jgi:Winged helix DNA-binding domain
MWSCKPAKPVLDALFAAGELVIAGRVNIQRRYDLPERVLPAEVLDAPIPSEQEAVKTLVAQAVRARGALTEFAIAEHVRPIWEFLGGAKRRSAVRRLPRRRGEARAARRRGRPRAGRRRGSGRAGPSKAERRLPPVAVRQPALGLPVRDALLGSSTSSSCTSPRPSGATATTCCPSSGATGSSGARISNPSGVRARSSSRRSTWSRPSAAHARCARRSIGLSTGSGAPRASTGSCDENQPGEQLAAGFGYRHETSSGPSVAGLGSGP